MCIIAACVLLSSYLITIRNAVALNPCRIDTTVIIVIPSHHKDNFLSF